MAVQGFKFALDPTPRQVRNLYRHAGAARFAYNWGLARIKANLDQREAERSYGVAEAKLTPTADWSLYGLRRAWNQAKADVAPWWAECSKEAYSTGLGQLAQGLRNWKGSRSGTRKGPTVGFPRFRTRRTAVPSVRFTTGTIRVEADRTHITLPVVGTIKTHESTRKLARVSRTVSRRRGPDWRTGQQPSNRWQRANAARSRVHHRVANQRADGLHKLTTRLAAEYGTVVIEDLNVAGMMRNFGLARHVADAGFGEIRRQLTYKTCWHGGHLVVADRWYPSSKTCSRCKTVKPKLPLTQRVFACRACGLVIDRDLNAARNLAGLAGRHVARSGRETLNGRGADCKTAPGAAVGCETSTPHPASSPDQTGTFARYRADLTESLNL